MIPCEVVNANNTGKPCPNPGTETAELVYPSGVSETKRCCPEHAAMVQKASDAARAILAARAEARRAESDARAERLAALRTARAIRPVAESRPADPVPPVTPVTEIPTMPDPTSTTTTPKPARGKPAPKPERSSLGGVLACRACGKSASYPLCKADRERVRKLRLLKLLPADFDAKTSPISILDEAWAAFEVRKAGPAEPDEDWSRADALLDAAIVNGETSDPEAPAIVPPKVGDRWGDLSPEQRAMVPDGSLLYFAEDRETCEKKHGSWPYEAMHDDDVITRLGPAPTATPEPDRSGWPVLVKYEGLYTWPSGNLALANMGGDVGWWAYIDIGHTNAVSRGNPTAQAAADAIQARLPEDVAPVTVPDPRDAEIADLRSHLEDAGRTFAEFREKVAAAIEARLPTATDDPLLARIMDVAVDYTSATATVQQVVDALAGKEPPDGYTSSIAKSVAELRVDEEYEQGRIAGDVARFKRCRQDLARALGMNVPGDLALVERWDELLGRVSTLERERDEAVRSIAALRADADELRALREALVSGKGRGIGKASLDALNAAEDRMLDAVRERTRASDDQTVAVLKYATERILDSIATASDEGRPADRSLLEAVRAIAVGKVP